MGKLRIGQLILGLAVLVLTYHLVWLGQVGMIEWREKRAVAQLSVGEGSLVDGERRWFLMPSLLSRWFAKDGISEVTVMRGADLTQFPELRNVYAISIAEEPLDRRALPVLKDCDLLTFLFLGPWITDDDLAAVAEITQVRRL